LIPNNYERYLAWYDKYIIGKKPAATTSQQQ
jgi:hypothetical protein